MHKEKEHTTRRKGIAENPLDKIFQESYILYHIETAMRKRSTDYPLSERAAGKTAARWL